MSDGEEKKKRPEAETNVTIFDLSDHGESRANEDESFKMLGTDMVAPPISPDSLLRRVEESYALRPNIDAYVTNIDGFGYNLKPAIDLDSKKASDLIRDAIVMEQIHTSTDLEDFGDTSETAIAAKRIEIERASHIERLRLEIFFNSPSVGMSLTALRKRLRYDLEATGNAYIEVVRNKMNYITQLTHLPTSEVRLLKRGSPTKVKMKRRISPIAYSSYDIKRRFRRFAQKAEGSNKVVYFKEVGDPRLMSSRTGVYYADFKDMQLNEAEHDEVATEVIHLSIYDPRSPYGMPRWQGATMAVLGGRAAEEVNYNYFDEKTIPPGFLLVSGAPLKHGADKKIEQYMKDHLKGRRNFWTIMVIEAHMKELGPGEQPPRARIEWVPMTDQNQSDALFQNYDERNGEKIGNMFRLPKLLRGEMKDFNRSTATEALNYAEHQVFEPERQAFDEVINEVLFPIMDVKYWRFSSNSPMNRDPVELADILDKIGPKYLTGKEARDILEEDVLNRNLEDIDEDWARKPFEIYKLQPSQGDQPGGLQSIGGTAEVPDDIEGMVNHTEALRDELASAMGNEAAAEKMMIALAELPRERIVITEKVAAELFDFDAVASKE